MDAVCSFGFPSSSYESMVHMSILLRVLHSEDYVFNIMHGVTGRHVAEEDIQTDKWVG